MNEGILTQTELHCFSGPKYEAVLELKAALAKIMDDDLHLSRFKIYEKPYSFSIKVSCRLGHYKTGPYKTCTFIIHDKEWRLIHSHSKMEAYSYGDTAEDVIKNFLKDQIAELGAIKKSIEKFLK